MRSRPRGFTLVELMVALAGGLFVSLAVFSIARQSSKFSSSQTRVSDATMQSIIAFERLQADISRAGFLTTPNVTRDPRFCGSLDASAPQQLRTMSSIFVGSVATTQLSTEITENGMTPKNLVLTGSYASQDQFEVASIPDSADPQVVILNPDSFGLVNMGFTANPTQATLERVFAPGRILRVVDLQGDFQFGVIASVSAAPPTITLQDAPALQFRSSSTQKCGIQGHGTGALVNVVNVIRYRIDSLSADSNYSTTVYGNGPFSEATRRELIRDELQVNGTPFPNSDELVGEYAVDLDFTFLVENPVGGALTVEDSATWVDQVPSATSSPQFIRAVRAWLTIRSREADRTVGLSMPAGSGPRLLRMNLRDNSSALPPAFARVRSQQALIPLTNQQHVRWQ